jgi:hypothetical protein
MPQLLAVAEYITKTLAICMVCGAPANRTYRKVKRGGRVVVGGAELYEARCRRCFLLGDRVHAPAPGEDGPVWTPPRPAAAEPAPRKRRARTRNRRQASPTQGPRSAAAPAQGGTRRAPSTIDRRRRAARGGVRAASGLRV